MKTTTQNTKQENQKSGLLSRPEQLSTGSRMSAEQAKERVAAMKARRDSRQLKQEAVLNLIKQQLPQQYKLTEIVGRWIWLHIPKAKHHPYETLLWRLGFHWNQRRGVFQHPCGVFEPLQPHPGDPRDKYTSYFVSEHQPA